MRNYLESSIAILMGMVILGFILIGFTGCTESTLVQPLETMNKVNSPTADELMLNFALAYGGRDLGLYEQLLHEDFVYTFNQDAVNKLGPTYEFFTKEDELITAAKMFSGKPVVNSQGRTVAAITDIEFLSWQKVGDWEMTGDMDRRGSMRGVYEGTIHFTREGDRDFTIRGRQMFTVVMDEVSGDEGGSRPNYKIIGWQDLSGW